jgi:hypothetical protein
MYVRTADGGFVDLDEYLSGTRLGNRNLPQFQTYSCNRLYQRVHELCHNRPPVKYIIRLFGSPYVDSIRLARPVVNTKFEKFFARIRACLINGGMPNSERFFRWARQKFAGILTDFKNF